MSWFERNVRPCFKPWDCCWLQPNHLFGILPPRPIQIVHGANRHCCQLHNFLLWTAKSLKLAASPPYRNVLKRLFDRNFLFRTFNIRISGRWWLLDRFPPSFRNIRIEKDCLETRHKRRWRLSKQIVLAIFFFQPCFLDLLCNLSRSVCRKNLFCRRTIGSISEPTYQRTNYAKDDLISLEKNI